MKKISFLFLLFSLQCFAQHSISADITFNFIEKTASVQQKIVFINQTNDTLKTIYLNDWNHAYSSKNSPLANRFSDEFERKFHIAKEKDRGYTQINYINGATAENLEWFRVKKHPDIIQIFLKKKLLPAETLEISLDYVLKFPNEKFTGYGFYANGSFALQEFLVVPAQFKNNHFIIQSNENLNDCSNAYGTFLVQVHLPENYQLTTNASVEKNNKTYQLTLENQNDLRLYLEKKASFETYKNDVVEVATNLKDNRLKPIQKALLIDKITKFVSEQLGKSKTEKIVVSQLDYSRNPINGMSDLPTFLRPFPDEFVFELNFLKTYLHAFLQANTQLNHRNDYWVLDGIQMYLMMNYIDENYPNCKMMGSLSTFKLLKGYNFFNLTFNEQYSYLYLLMARKNLDQSLSNDQSTLIKFNQQIANKYKAGLVLKMLESYTSKEAVLNGITTFLNESKTKFTTRTDFEHILKQQTNQNIDWIFKNYIESRNLVDYAFEKSIKTKDSIAIKLVNKTQTNVPIPLYAFKNDTLVYKQWLTNITKDSVLVFKNNFADKFVLNYDNEVIEFNNRNNWKATKGFFLHNRPLKITFLKDLENPYYNQLFFVPEWSYNLYDGLAIGMSFHNKSILNKPFTFNIMPTYASKPQTLIGSASFSYLQNYRNGWLHNIRYSLGGSVSHYAPNALYMKFNPSVTIRFKDPDFRKNHNEYFLFRYISINREPSNFTLENLTESYSVFNARFYNGRSEIKKHFNVSADVQIATIFGKISGEIQYRKLFQNNRQLSIRGYFGGFLYRKSATDYFDFGVYRPSDYLFDYNLLGRSETTGLFSQQYVMADAGFKTKFTENLANQWVTSVNSSINIWNWVEVYADAGFIKNKTIEPKFLFDSGLRLNLVPDYFELYMPVYSSNGYELKRSNYTEKIRFVVTLSPKTLTSLFTRKWF